MFTGTISIDLVSLWCKMFFFVKNKHSHVSLSTGTEVDLGLQNEQIRRRTLVSYIRQF